jgi:glycolate oxidase
VTELDSAALLDKLAAELPDSVLVADPAVVAGFSRDQAALPASGVPLALVRPTETAQVQTVMRFATQHGVPVVARGAGSGLTGGANAVDGCLVLSLVEMNAILDIDTQSMLATVQPGVITADLAAAVAEHGLWYPPDPASYEFSTLGGNVATNAGGLCCVKYGVTRDWVLGLEVVMADGEAVRTGRRTVKGVAGYDLTSLFVGSEGTLGIITEATLRLRPAPGPAATLAAFFPSLVSAGRAVTGIVTSGVPSVLELMDRTTVRAVEEWKRMDLDLDAAALLFACSDLGGDAGRAHVAQMARQCQEAGASLVVETDDPLEARELLAARRLAFPALERLGSVLLDDVGVPVGRIAGFLEEIELVAKERGVLIGTFGHAGDGNMHPTIVFDPDDPSSRARAQAAFEDIARGAVRAGGTITGEHGVGLVKLDYLESEIGSAALGVHALVKRAFDPLGVLNPGKVLRDATTSPGVPHST